MSPDGPLSVSDATPFDAPEHPARMDGRRGRASRRCPSSHVGAVPALSSALRSTGATHPARPGRKHPRFPQRNQIPNPGVSKSLTRSGDRSCRIPFDVDAAGKGVRDCRPCLNHRLLTLRVSQNDLLLRFHPGRFRRFGRGRQFTQLPDLGKRTRSGSVPSPARRLHPNGQSSHADAGLRRDHAGHPSHSSPASLSWS